MDKSWIALGSSVDGRISRTYYDGVISFLRFAMAVIDRDGKILCPSRKCVNVVRQNIQIVQIHLLQHGIIPTYTIWQHIIQWDHYCIHYGNTSYSGTITEEDAPFLFL